MFNGEIIYFYGPSSIAMLVYQRVFIDGTTHLGDVLTRLIKCLLSGMILQTAYSPKRISIGRKTTEVFKKAFVDITQRQIVHLWRRIDDVAGLHCGKSLNILCTRDIMGIS